MKVKQANALLSSLGAMTLDEIRRDRNLLTAVIELLGVVTSDETAGSVGDKFNMIVSVPKIGGKVELVKFLREFECTSLKDALNEVNNRAEYKDDGSIEIRLHQDLVHEDVMRLRRRAASIRSKVQVAFEEV